MKKQLLSVLVIFVITTTFYNTQAQTPMLYGLSLMGGDNTDGNIFEYTVNGSFASVHSFGIPPDGEAPWGSLIYASNKLLYGMTEEGGTYNKGTIFSFNIFTGKDSVVHSFAGSSDGDFPKGGALIQVNDSMLYGMTTNGGTSGIGTIFSFNINSGSESALYSFAGGTSDGLGPYGSLTEVNDSMLYGMTLFGGTDDSGVIFSYDINSGKEKVVHSFAGGDQDGGDPSGSLLLVNDSLLYGLTTYGGSAGYGAIITYNISKGTESVVHSFIVDTLGWYPYSSLIQATNGLLYGTTSGYGGAVFSYNINTNAEKILHNFIGGVGDGDLPYGAVMQASDGNLYGLTAADGANDDGVLFSYDIADSTYSVLIAFDGYNAWEPYFGNLVEADTAGTPTGLKQLSVDNRQLPIYPNPNNGEFTVKLNNNQIGYTLEVYNVMGEKIYQSVLSNSQNTINIGDKPDGMYFVYLKSGNGVVVTKMLITK